MRLGAFIATTLILSIGAGLTSTLYGAGAGRAVLTGIAVLIGLQVVYFLFLILRALFPGRERND